MDTNFETYVSRINYTLEHLIAPEIESDYMQGEIFAIMELLNQLVPRLEYRHDLLLEDIDRMKGIIDTVIKAFSRSNIEVPEEIEAAVKIETQGITGKPLKEIYDQLESIASEAIDLLHKNKNRIENAQEFEKNILQQVTQGIFRDISLFRPEIIFEKAEQYQQKEE